MNNPIADADHTTVTIADSPERRRYEIRVDDVLAGFTAYIDHEDQRIFYHTEIDTQFSGRGLAGRLVAAALADTRPLGTRIVPVCPVVAGFLAKHQEFDDIVDPVTPQALAVVERERA
ncbi:putative GNAT family acetyltransferase [Nocardia sp. GAS34]|uniref:GNAT family N-acetyltransferase n=1 Tax=unclassified Nocardia TaxID=2637762 RepID=UPI003D201A30